MPIAKAEAALVMSGADFILPAWLKEIVEFARNISLIAIPFVFWFASRFLEKRRSTLDLIKSLDNDISNHLERLYKYRKYEDGKSNNISQTQNNPYEQAPILFYFDSVRILNFYEGVCTEIVQGALDEDLLYKSVRNSIIGSHDVVLARYNEKVGADQSNNYQNLVEIARRWKARGESHREIGATHIPGN